MKHLLILIFWSLSIISSAQVDMGILGTSKIKESEMATFKKKAISSNASFSMQHIQFMIDTFTIEKNLQLYLDDGVNMNGVIGWAFQEYDKLLNRTYKQLLSLCTAKAKAALAVSEKAWLDFREKELKFADLFNNGDNGIEGGGRIAELDKISRLTQFTKERVVALENYREMGPEGL